MDLNDFPSLEQLVPLMPGHVYLLDKHGVYRGCNELQAQDIGLKSREEIVGQTNKTLPIYHYNPKLIDLLDSNNKKVMESARSLEFEEQAPLPDGTIRTFKSYKMPIFNGNKEVIGLLGMSFDISEVKSEFAKLQEKQSQTELALDNIMANLPGHVYWVDTNNIVLGCNDAQARDLGLKSRAEIIGMCATSFQTPDNAKKIIENNNEVIFYGKIVEEEENFVSREGIEQTYLSKKVPLKNKNGQILGLLGISFDITDLKKAQEHEKNAIQEATEAKIRAQIQEELQKVILTFTGTMSHDLRTPLSTIALVDSHLLKTMPALLRVYERYKQLNANFGKEDPDYIDPGRLKIVNQYYDRISDALKQAEIYIDATLKIIKGVASGSELLKNEDLALCSIEEVIRQVISTYPFQNEEERKKVHATTVNAFDFMGNSIFMARIIQNLIKNSFEQIYFKNRGEVFIRCEEGADFNYLYIKDTAGGVSQSIIEHLFNGFNSTKHGGTGIGLSSAKQIMQAFGGNISCHLIDEDCIEFILSFPKIEQSEAQNVCSSL